MANRLLRGTRYLDKENEKFAASILEELPFLDYRETNTWYRKQTRGLRRKDMALLGCNDRFFLFTGLLGRTDGLHPWLFDRFREVEEDPDGHIDLWSRFHYKSSCISFAGAIQEVVCDPEIKIALFSVVRPIAQAFLSQIKDEFENNEFLKGVYSDVLYQNPRVIGADGRPAKWGLSRGITVKRRSNPKEATVEAHGLIDGQPTSRHYDLHIYDDMVTQDYLSEDAIRKTTERWELADNLGSHLGVRKWMVGTRYHHADTYGVVIERKSLKPRIYPATEDGTINGRPVFLSKTRWDEIKRDQRSTVSAQCLLNPVAGNEASFKSVWLKTYDVIPAVMNVYILVDPSKGASNRSDRTAIAVIGIDHASNKYLLDGVCHRMKLSDRWQFVRNLKSKWEAHPGVQLVRVGWERYGKDVELEVLEDIQQREGNVFEITELNTPRQGGHSKNDRIERLEPDIRGGRFYLPCVAYHPDFGGKCYWSVWSDEEDRHAYAVNTQIEWTSGKLDVNEFETKLRARKFDDQEIAAWKTRELRPHEKDGLKHTYHIGQIVYRKWRGLTKRQAEVRQARIVDPIRRADENGQPYDLTRSFIDEAIRHPFATHDDMIDAVSRIYDIEPLPPVLYEVKSTEPIGLEGDDVATGSDDDGWEDVRYDPASPGSMGVAF